MAHVAKVKSPGVSTMVGHYNREAERRGYRRDNIDSSRTPENYVIGAPDGDALAGAVRARVSSAVGEHERLTGKALRKDANVVMDWVVTLPRDCPDGLQEKFFETVVRFIQERYGAENVPGGFVHLDEATPHVHVPVVPVKDGRLQASKVINRADLKAFHGDLGRAVDAALGVHVSIELDEDRQGEKQLSHLDQEEYRAAKDKIAATEKRLERLQRREGELDDEVGKLRDSLQRGVEPATETVSESAGALWKARGDGRREKVLRGEIEDLRSRLSASEREERELGAEVERLEREVPELERGVGVLEGRLAGVKEKVRKAIERLGYVPETVSRFAKGIAASLHAPVLSALGVAAQSARAASHAMRAARMVDRWSRERD